MELTKYVEWTDQDDNGFTKVESKTLPHATSGYQDNVHSDLSGAVNSTYSSPGILVEQNSTAAVNQSKTMIESENITNAAGTLNQSAPASNLDESTLGSNSSSSSTTPSEASNMTTVHESNLDNNITNTKNTKNVDIRNLSPSTGKLIADKIAGQMYTEINGTLGDQDDKNSLSAEDENSGVDGDAKNVSAERLAAITAAENALKAKENEIGKMDRRTNSSDNAPDPSTIKNEIIAVETKSSQEIGQKESEHQGVTVELNTKPLSSDTIQTQDNPVNSKQSQPREDLNDNQLGVKKEESNTQQQGQVVVKERQRPQENVRAAKDKMMANSRIPDSDVRTNELSSQSSDRTHTDNEARKKIANLEVQKIEDKQKTMNKNRFMKLENEKKQSLENEARHNVQNQVQKAESALNIAQELTKQAKLADQKAQAALDEAKSRQKGTQKDQEGNNNILSPELTQMINEAKISDQMAQIALEKYNNLRRAANTAVEDFVTKFK